MSCYTARQSAYGNVMSALSIHFRLHVEGKKDVLYKHDIVFPETVTFLGPKIEEFPYPKLSQARKCGFMK